MNSRLSKFISNWTFTRSLSLDLLRSLGDDQLDWSPGPGVGTFAKQFRHIGRVQENYMAALDTGVIQFSTANTSYGGGSDIDALCNYLAQLDNRLRARLETIDDGMTIDWFGEQVSLWEHLARMDSHETLHHGQWIVYCQLLGKPFPPSWSVWGL